MAGHVFHLVPHTHWDREWYLTRAGFLARLVPMLDDLLDRLEREPAFRSFLLDGQTVLLEDYLRVRPDQRARVAALVGAGRLQVGPWYVLPDELIPSGESLVRNLLAGAADAARLGGRLDALYSPDAFGHPAVLPALAAEFGIGHGVLWRGLGGEAGQEGDLFRWRAPDGREMVVHHLPPDGYEIGAAVPAGWPALRQSLLTRAATRHVLVPVGADHHAAHPALAEARDALAALEPESEVRVSRLDEFLASAAAEAGAVPRLEGELRWSYGYTWTLQGVHGTRAGLKRKHSLAELALERLAEPLAALAAGHGVQHAGPLLTEAWRTLLRSQFHDSIAGCTSDAVARRVEARIEDAEVLAGEIARTCFDALVGNDPDGARARPQDTARTLIFWNPAARPRAGVAVVDLTWLRRDVLVGPPGNRVARTGPAPRERDIARVLGGLRYQLLGRTTGQERLDAMRHYPDQDEVEITRVAVPLGEIDGFGFATPRNVADGLDRVAPVRVRERALENGLVRAEVERDGSVALTDLASGVRRSGLLVLESEGDVGDTYTWAGPPADQPQRPSGRAPVRRLARGPLVGSLEVEVGLPCGRSPDGRGGRGRVEARVVLSLHAGSPALRCTVEIHNRACDHRLRLRLRGVAPGDAVLAGGPFGPVRRGRVRTDRTRYVRETPVATAPAHRFVVPSDASPLAMLAPGFFEYEHTPAGDLLVTVLRAIGALSRGDLPTRPGHAAWPEPTPLAQSLGRERIQLALQPLAAAHGATAVAAWEDCFLPIRGIWLRQATATTPPAGGLTLEGPGLVLSAVKPAASGGGLVLRCYNASDSPAEGRWRLPFPAAGASVVRADEQDPRAATLEHAGRTVVFTAAPRALVTLALTR